MKILHLGQPKATPIPFWIGKEVTCKYCNTLIQLENGDKVFHERFPGNNIAVVECPICRAFIDVVDTPNTI